MRPRLLGMADAQAEKGPRRRSRASPSLDSRGGCPHTSVRQHFVETAALGCLPCAARRFSVGALCFLEQPRDPDEENGSNDRHNDRADEPSGLDAEKA